MKKIRLHPVRSNSMTDEAVVQHLQQHTPAAFCKSQDVLVAAEKMLKPASLFSSEKKRRQRLQRECYALRDALRSDGYRSEDLTGLLSAKHGDVVVDYLSEFSDAFPNWQKEYEHLNEMMPLMFS